MPRKRQIATVVSASACRTCRMSFHCEQYLMDCFRSVVFNVGVAVQIMIGRTRLCCRHVRENRSMVPIATTDSSLVITLITYTSLACSKIKDRMQITTRTIVSNVRGEFVYSLINSGRMSNRISSVNRGPLLVFFAWGISTVTHHWHHCST